MSEIFIFDFETSGLPVFKEPSGGDNQPHVVQVAAITCDSETRKIKQSLDVIIKPDGWEIPQEVIDIHGITNEYAKDVGVPEKLAFEMFFAMWNENLQVAYNTTFDRRIARIGTKRFFSEELQEIWHKSEYECAMVAAKKDMGVKSVKLVDAYKHYTGNELVGAHSAMADTKAAMAVYFAIKDKQ